LPLAKENDMAIFTVGPNSTFPTIADAMAAAGPGDIILLEEGYSNETATILYSGMTIDGGGPDSLGIVLELGTGVATVTLAGDAPIDVVDASDGNGIVGNDGDNLVTVTAGADAVSGGAGEDRLFVDYRLATGAVTGDSTSNFAEAGGGGRLVTINGGFEHFTIWTGAGADTITTGDGNDDIRTGDGAGTIVAGEGVNTIVGGSDADTITAGNGGNFVDAGDGTNTVTTGGGADEILSGSGADTIVAGAGEDRITVTGGADTVDAGAGSDLLIVDYSAAVTNVTGGVTGGNLGSGYTGHFADTDAATLDFVEAEQFLVTTGSGNDSITTGAGEDRITTGAGNDLLVGGGGADILSGGSGDDVYFLDDGGDQVIEAEGEGFDAAYTSVSFVLAEDSEVEWLSADAVYGTGAIDLTGSATANYLLGNQGANILDGGGGADVLVGYGGNDTYYVDNGSDAISEAAGEGFDAVYTDTSYTLGAGVEVEWLAASLVYGTGAIDLTGNEIANYLLGNEGANILNGGGGADVLVGYGGSDTYYVDDAGDVIIEAGGGFDAVYASASYTLTVGAEVEWLSTDATYGTGAINLTGNDAGNYVLGNDGANVLDGGDGNDVLIGYGGADTFLFSTALGAGNVDTIIDFVAGTDRIALDDSMFTGLGLGTLGAGAFATGATAGDADDRIVYNSATGQLFFDADGNGAGAAVQFAALQPGLALNAADFFVI
jgi:Ca2+-binding RTX toxin-like protein